MTAQRVYLKAKTDELVLVPNDLAELFKDPSWIALLMAEAIIEPLGIINF